jgi:hypothetical protein
LSDLHADALHLAVTFDRSRPTVARVDAILYEHLRPEHRASGELASLPVLEIRPPS